MGEGTGFGVPAARYRDKEYFSGSSTIQISQKSGYATVTKQFSLNMVSVKRFRDVWIENKVTRKLARRIAELYQKHRYWRPLMQQKVLNSIGFQTSFIRVKPAGKVTVTYHVDSSSIHVKVDYKSLEKKGLQKIFLLNEQSSRFFRKYRDSDGSILFDKQIGAWENVEADWASIAEKCDKFGFRLWNIKDAILRRGREFIDGTLDWIGLDYEIASKKTCFEYDIEIFRSSKQK